MSASPAPRRLLIRLLLLLPTFDAAAQCLDYTGYLHAVAILPLTEAPRQVVHAGDDLYVLADRLPWESDILYIVDAAVPAQPVQVDSLVAPPSANGFDIDQGYAYFATGSDGMRVLDLADTTRTGGLPLPWTGTAVAVTGGLAYVGHAHPDTTQLLVVDVTDPLAPALLGTASLPTTMTGDIQAIAVVGGYAFLAAAGDGVQVVDVSDPAAPAHVAGVPTPGAALDLEPRGDHLLVADNYSGLTLVDVSNPLSPFVASNLRIVGWAKGVSHVGDTAYLATVDHGGLQAVDISDPLVPVQVGSLPAREGLAQDVCALGDHAFVLEPRAGLRVVDAVNPASPSIGTFDPAGDDEPQDIRIVGDLAYVATYIYGTLMIFDITDPDAPVELGQTSVGNEAFTVDVVGDLACTAFLNWGGQSGIRVVDVADPAAPVVVGTYTPGGAVYEVVMAGGRAYVTTPSGVDIVDLAVPSSPTRLGTIPEPGTPEGSVAVAGNVAYVGNADGLTVWDVAAPATPVLLGSEAPALPVDVLALAADLAYADDGAGGMRIIDVADPAAPLALGGVVLADGSRDLAVDGDVVYAAVGWSGLQVIDVADPAAPRIVGAFALPSVTHAVGVGADRLWLTAAYVHTAPLHCPAISAAGEPPPAPVLALNAWPNPFNPRTTLAFELPAAAPVSLVVYDLAGRRVRTLAAGEVLGAGAHTRTWLGRDDRGRAVASGVYLYRLEAGARRAARRVTLIR